jgi:hypothetical protein
LDKEDARERAHLAQVVDEDAGNVTLPVDFLHVPGPGQRPPITAAVIEGAIAPTMTAARS